MPLAVGSDRATIAKNIHELTVNGSRPRSHAQIVAIALSEADRSRRAAAGGGIGAPHMLHLAPIKGGPGIGGAGSAVHPAMSPSQGTPWWTRGEARQMGKGFAEGGDIGFAAGGMSGADSPWTERQDAKQITQDIPFHAGGLINSSVSGRTDRIPLALGAESHVIPADVVSGSGQGATSGGANNLQAAMKSGPWGVPLPKAVRGRGPPAAPHAAGLGPDNADLGRAGAENADLATGGHGSTSILAAGGELVVPPDVVEDIGRRGIEQGMGKRGETDLQAGHRLLDEMIAKVREFNIRWLKHAPAPKR